VKEFVMKIYSRWGSLVYETNDFQKGWNGVNDNNEIITGVYTYYVEVLNVFGEVHKYEGVFNLIR
jgi:gliding motility-associated-like protein